MYYVIDKPRRQAVNDTEVLSLSPLKLNLIWTDCLDRRAWAACPTRAIAQSVVDAAKEADPTSQAEVVPMAEGPFVFMTGVDEYTEAKNWLSSFQHNIKKVIGVDRSGPLIKRFTANFETDDISEYKNYNGNIIFQIRAQASDLIKDIECFGNKDKLTNSEDLFFTSLCYAFDYIRLQKKTRKEKPFVFLDAISGLRSYIAELGGKNLTVWEKELEKILDAYEKAKNTLYERRMQMLRKDAYGFVDPVRWEVEKKTFAETLVRVSLDRKTTSLVGYTLSNVICFDMLDQLLDEYDKNEIAENSASHEKSSGWLDYEDSCIESLTRNGWSASGTPRTGDKGADLIASKRGIRVVGQCKYWKDKINSSAIQEVVTAKLYFEAQFAVIFCENGCTPQAQEMADRLKVIVANQADIPELEMMLIRILV